MPITLTTPQAISNGTRLVFSRIRVDEDAKTLDFTVSMRTGAAGTPPDSGISTRRLQIRAGDGDRVSRQDPVAGGNLEDFLVFAPGAIVRAAAFDDALAAWKTSKAAFEAHCLSAGYVHSSLAGT